MSEVNKIYKVYFDKDVVVVVSHSAKIAIELAKCERKQGDSLIVTEIESYTEDQIQRDY